MKFTGLELPNSSSFSFSYDVFISDAKNEINNMQGNAFIFFGFQIFLLPFTFFGNANSIRWF